MRDDADPRFSLIVLPTLLQLRWRRGLVIDRSDIARAGSAVTASDSGALPLLVEVTALREVTWDAREAFVAYARPAPIAILGSDAVDLVLTAFAVRSPTETRFFTDRDEAVRWLLPGERMQGPDVAHSEPWRP
ncbi:STAS/SEC14 domain-containing protein [Arthrobacter sp. NPDC092385]|uniref:STAS/SEC14 domain-containing protein n=1 Tax=Arthrobacter sp. NPDC092385 TaxID=3363943 RepID=UPI003807D88C